jgi:glycosyltransferase involved in cell wall biosynthesis
MSASPATSAPLVSVVVSTYREVADGSQPDGADSTLARAVRSVMAQTYRHWELVVVSDHPPLPDRERIEGFVRGLGDSRVRHHDLPEHGGIQVLGSSAKRAGIERSSGPLIAFLEADNEWDPGHLERGAAAFQQDPALDLVYADTMVRLASSCPEAPLLTALAIVAPPARLLGPLVGATFRWNKPDWDPRSRQQLEQYNFIDASDAIFRRDSYLAAGPLPLSVDSDWLLWRRFLRAGRDRFRHVPHVGSYFATTTWQQHANYFALTLVQQFGIPFDMRAKQAELRQARDAVYSAKHQA